MRVPTRILLYFSCVAIYICIALIVIDADKGGELLYTILRIAGLWGFLSLSCSVIMNLFKPELRKLLGQPFLPVHHLFALSGLLLITLHPILFLILSTDPSTLIPDLSSPYLFFVNGGRVALIIIYAAFFAGLFRIKIGTRWKIIHRLVYPALLLAIIHANLIGSTFQSPIIRVFYNGLAVAVLVTSITRMFRHRREHQTSA
ncbi:ferric reductase-like transmembrane domain-containing protein [uncultured Methanospirillum sp.]|uniref:ferric reductase-like transmembrane domain-containing protein n=1 Tax=uncultured Methanospirillum sp. TaxID=262503 RepID=UPI0029C8032B|nr:ferric reductase-like transmembrane domain-containing protein [uncultured Methanospirillum sp.]